MKKNINRKSVIWLSLIFFSLMNPIASQAQCALICNSNLNVSLSPNCEATIGPDAMIKNLNTTTCIGPFVIEIYDALGNVIPSNPVVTSAYIGMSLDVRAIDNASGLFCWGSIHIEDKIPPIFTCVDDTIACNDTIPSIVVNDSCDPNPSLTFSETTSDLDCSDPEFNFLITRLYTATDASGNSSTCEQIIRLSKPNLGAVTFPPNYDGFGAPALDCENPDVSPENTGSPSINGASLGDFCKINVDFSDQIVDICDGSYKILRKWTVFDCCTSEILTHFQVIKVLDQTGPMINCPNDFTTSTDFNACTATVLLPLASATDNCAATDSIRFDISWAFGDGSGPFTGIPIGQHVVTYTATDACDNSSSCAMTITVEDQIIPVAVCNATTVSLVTDSVKVFAASFDAGSADNCAIDAFAVRRMEDSLFMDCVFFDCDDVNDTVMVVFQVCDTVGLCNTCMVEVIVNDKTPPSITCPADVMLDCNEYPPNPAQIGVASATDNCTIDSIYFIDTENINSCNVGTIIRTWYARDLQGLIDSCEQMIVIGDANPATYFFPPDTLVQCLEDSDPSITGLPMVNDNCPNSPGIGNQDLITPIIPNCKYLIQRNWIILDECNDTIVEQIQIIQVEDTAAPVFDDAPGALDADFNCIDEVIFPNPSATDNCNDAVIISLMEADTLPGACPNNFTINLTYIASDSCGNLSADYHISLNIRDSLPPTANPLDTLGPFTCVANINPPNINDVTGLSDNCSNTISVVHQGDTSAPTCSGQLVRSYQLTDLCGNTTNLTQIILLNDNVAPTANPLPDLGPFDCISSVPPADIAAITGESDNCGGMVSVTYLGDTGSPVCSGSIIRTYQLGDACGNTTDLNQTISIDDQIAPDWNEAIGALDLSFVCGSDVGNIPSPSATDNCNGATISQISDDTLSIACANVYVREIAYQATDDCGNVSIPYLVRIVVNDTIRPEWTNPVGSLDNSFVCTDDLQIPNVPTATDNCGVVTVSLIADDTTALNCTDQYLRTLTYEATDDCGVTASMPFVVRLTVNDDVPPVWNETPGDLDTSVVCPADIVLLPPTATDNCSAAIIMLIGSDTLSINCSNQYTQRFLYQAVDSCGNIQPFVFPVLVTVQDTVAPIITSCPRDTTDTDLFPLCSEPYEFLVEAIDNCGNLNFRYTRSDMPNMVFPGPDASGDYPPGTTVVTYFADDGCGNVDTCSHTIFIDDITNPSITCPTAIFVEPFPESSIPLFPSNFVAGKDDCSPTTPTFSGSNPNLMSFSCDDLMGMPFIEINFPVILTDTFGNFNSCIGEVIVVNTNCAVAPLSPIATITGQVITDENIAFPDASIQVSNDEMEANSEVLNSGYYVLPNLEVNQDYTIRPSSNIDPTNGVNTLDLILIAQHILGMDSLDSPYQMIAADANRSGTISIADLIDISRLILNIEEQFPNNTSWRFVPASHEFNDPTNPFLPSFPEEITINDLEQSQHGMNFIAIKTGDVNSSVAMSNLDQQGDTRNDQQLTFRMEDQLMEVGESYLFEFKAKDFNQLLGYQFTIDFDPRYVEFVHLEEHRLSTELNLTTSNFGWSDLAKGKIRANWYQANTHSLADETVLFALRFKAKAEIPISRVIELNSNSLRAEAYGHNGEKMTINLEFSPLQQSTPQFKLYQNRPNPFKATTLIPFLLPQAGQVSLTVTDVSGNRIKSLEQYFEAGYHEVSIEQGDLPSPGLFFYQIKIGDQQATRKMIATQ
ncbi:MAG: HYR domain-containing protein [Bacteroidota bacterium]